MACRSKSALPKKVSLVKANVLREKVYQFRIELHGLTIQIWRKIQVPSDYCFYALHSAILDAFGWEGRRLYRFASFTTKPEVDAIELPFRNGVDFYENDPLIRDYFTSGGHAALYFYDDQWRFHVLLERIVHRSDGVSYPLCVTGRRHCAREGSFSVRIYQFLLEVAANRRNSLWSYYADYLKSKGHSESFNRRSVVFKDPKERFQLFCEHFRL